MDIARVGDSSFKIRTKNTTFIINPEKKVDGDVVILTSKPKDYALYEGKLVIDGPGEYEVAGVSIHGEEARGRLSFDFLEDAQKVLVISSPQVAKTRETEGYTATVVILDEEAGNSLSQVVSELVVVVGPDNYLPSDKSGIKKADKINLKKTEENKGFIIHLSK